MTKDTNQCPVFSKWNLDADPDLDGKRGEKELGGVEDGEILIRIYHMRKKSIFNRRKNFKKLNLCSKNYHRSWKDGITVKNV